MALTLNDLIHTAAAKAGSLGKLAEGMGRHQNRVTEWKKGTSKPDAHEIAYMAKLAGLPVLSTVAEIESQLDSRYSAIWSEALGKLTAAGVAASVLLGTAALSPDTANATTSKLSTSQFSIGSLYIMLTIVLRRLRQRVRFSDPQMGGRFFAF